MGAPSTRPRALWCSRSEARTPARTLYCGVVRVGGVGVGVGVGLERDGVGGLSGDMPGRCLNLGLGRLDSEGGKGKRIKGGHQLGLGVVGVVVGGGGDEVAHQ